MQIRIERDHFTTAIAWVARALATRPTEPVLAGVLLEADATAGSVTLSATDRETSATTIVPADVDHGGRVLISGPLLVTIAKLLPAKPITVTIDDTDVILGSGSARFSLPTLPIEYYPELPALPPYIGEVDAKAFADAVRQTTIAAGTDTTVPFLTAVRLEISNDQPLRLAATDRYRLAVRDLAWQPTTDAPEALALSVGARELDAAAKHLATTGGPVRLAAAPDEGLCGLSDGTQNTTLRLIDAPFPDYRDKIPTTFTGTATIPVDELAAAVKRVAVFAQKGAQVRLDFAPDSLHVSAGGRDTGTGLEPVTVDYAGSSTAIAFNPVYLLDALATTNTTHARLALTTPTRPAVLQGLNGDGTPIEHYRHIVVPIRLAGQPRSTEQAAAA